MDEETNLIQVYIDDLLENSYFVSIAAVCLLFIFFIIPSALIICSSWFLFDTIRQKITLNNESKDLINEPKKNIEVVSFDEEKNPLLLTMLFTKEKENNS
jgi:hypothetical protein